MAVGHEIVIDIKSLVLEPEEIASAFAEFDSHQQARFFSAVWQLAKAWPGAGWFQQSCDIVACADKDARNAIQTLAAHLNEEAA